MRKRPGIGLLFVIALMAVGVFVTVRSEAGGFEVAASDESLNRAGNTPGKVKADILHGMPVGQLSPAGGTVNVLSPPATVWNAGTFTFSQTGTGQKDCITAQTCLTRSTVLYNSVVEAPAGMQGCSYAGPANTEWAIGTIANWNTLTYQRLYLVNGCSPPNMVNYSLVLHLIAENIYLQVNFTNWVGHVGRFTYNRTTMPAAAANATVGGRVLTANGAGIGHAVVGISDGTNPIRFAFSSPFGFYSFANVPTGVTYTLSIESKRHTFLPRVVTVNGDLTDVDMVAQPEP